MATHFSGKSARSLPQNPMQRPTALTVSQSDSESFPLGQCFVLSMTGKSPWVGFLQSFLSLVFTAAHPFSSSFFFHHLCLCSSLSLFSSQFTVSNMQFPLFHMLFALVQSLHLSLPFLVHLRLLPVLLLFFLQQIIKNCEACSHKLCLIRQPEMIADIFFLNKANPQL